MSSVSKKERAIIEKYLIDNKIKKDRREIYEEAIYKSPIENLEKVDMSGYEKALDISIMESFEIDRKQRNNQILTGLKQTNN